MDLIVLSVSYWLWESDRTNAAHLSYLGDATLGTQVNIGAGTITANYDGVQKHRTQIGDRTHIHSMPT